MGDLSRSDGLIPEVKFTDLKHLFKVFLDTHIGHSFTIAAEMPTEEDVWLSDSNRCFTVVRVISQTEDGETLKVNYKVY